MKKALLTRTRILDDAACLASQLGFEGLSIGALAGRLGMSKSGLIAHFGSKQDLQLQVLKHAQERFVQSVFTPALREPAGLARLRALFGNMIRWADAPDFPGGCPILAAAAEFDGRPGLVHDAVVNGQKELKGAIVKAIRLGVETGELRSDVDPWQVAFEFLGVVLAVHHDKHLLGDARAKERALAALQRLIASCCSARQ